MKLTRHNGRAGKNGAYNPKHNDRSFNINNSEHIDKERAKGNIYWCYPLVYNKLFSTIFCKINRVPE